ncbi:methylated-DNA--[protein]-cysteine S-methyltransferase [Ornithinicoccus hortensis]|uniref:Methylated-DNA--protein-cysteine methyltransferase n=1 Tax=Ornithinicoccus hortensis TaxID=82346 RepID=A0A542YVZ0_9MICO|nr:methylated-DNA--[protein]-cysteine S-methyltransferase [Ornithinicoccus hortensis]TQL52232.1 methylated-DNA-[protein]-cysteine S-methyltransferase [Ornithinicoccus hortensis]
MDATTGTGPGRVRVEVGSPIGTLTLVADGDRLAGVYMEAHRHAPPPEAWGPRVDPGQAPPVLRDTASQLSAYFAGELTHFDLPLAPAGTEFQQRVWSTLRTIPYGTTWSYAQLAERIGAPGAARAVGLANGRNPISIVVPCHRVVGADGSLTGYGGGVERKRTLLLLEERVSGASLW